MYGSKTIVNTHHSIVYALQNFTSKIVTDTPLHDKNSKFTTLATLGLPKSEDVWAFQSNFTVTNINDRNMWHRIFCEQHYDEILRVAKMKDEERASKIRISTFQDYLLVQDIERRGAKERPSVELGGDGGKQHGESSQQEQHL